MTVSAAQCERMVKFGKCDQGLMTMIGNLKRTDNQLQWDYSNSGHTCCTWHDFEATNCFAYPSFVSKRYHNTYMESTAGPVSHCEYQSGECALKDGSFLQWDADSKEQCEFVPW